MFGKLMPKKDDDDAKGKKKKQAKKAPARKKDEPPPKPVKWAPPPSVAEPGTLEIIRNAKNELMENIFPSNIVSCVSNMPENSIIFILISEIL
jgi:hypothetical protein